MKLEQARAELAKLAAGSTDRPGEISLDISSQVASLLINNPRAQNALTLQMMVQLADCVVALRAWSGSVVLLSAGPGAFCSGGHLGQVRRAIDSPRRAEAMFTAMSCVLDSLLYLPQISVSALDGAAIGGGAELCTATDLRFMGPTSSVHFVHASLGIAPGWGGTARLVTHLGRAGAVRALLGGPISPLEGQRIGLATPAPKALLAAKDWAQGVASQHPEAVRAVKTQLGHPELAAAAFARVWGGAAHRAALDAIGRPSR